MAAIKTLEQVRSTRTARGTALGLRGWWRYLWATATAEDLEHQALQRLDEVRDVLERARDTLASGWVQNRWYAVAPRLGPQRSGLFGAATGDPQNVSGACLVGAVALALRERDARADLAIDVGAAVDFVWDAMQETVGVSGSDAAGRAWPRNVRLMRLRDLTRWNDEAGRTRDEVLGLLDRAVSRVIMAAMRRPMGAAR